MLARAIAAWRERDSLVVALYGGWGSGKTSIKNMTLETLPAFFSERASRRVQPLAVVK